MTPVPLIVPPSVSVLPLIAKLAPDAIDKLPEIDKSADKVGEPVLITALVSGKPPHQLPLVLALPPTPPIHPPTGLMVRSVPLFAELTDGSVV